MAVIKDENLIYPTEGLILKKSRRHFRAPVRSQHWQLRSLISAEKSHIVYFPGGTGSNHVQRLNTVTNECETIKLLSFSPRCLVADKGWVCCGGETGEFTAIPLDALDAEFDIDPSNPEAGPILGPFPARGGRNTKSLMAKSMKLAGDRVNCITLWFPPESSSSGDMAYRYKEPVAVLANNDKSVALVSLNDFHNNVRVEPFDVIKYPDYVNRAIISPDGQLLIAILDDPFLYIHRRAAKHPEQHRITRPKEADYHWEPCGQILLKSQRRDDESTSRGSFAACFNTSGTLLAVGTQYGTISVFDAAKLGDPLTDPLVTSFQSSKPEMGPGAIRDMSFAPGPYDLLAWTEDRSCIGVADVRSNFVTRQMLDITKEDEFEHVSIADRNTIDPQLLQRSDGLASTLSSALSLSSDNRRRRGAETQDRLGSPLTAEETMVLDALQEERRRRELRSQRTSERAPALGSQWYERAALSAANRDSEAPRVSRERSSSVSRPGVGGGNVGSSRERASSVTRAIGDLLGNIRDQRERAQERVRSAQLLLREAQERDRTAPMALRRSAGVRTPAGINTLGLGRPTGSTVAPSSSPWSDLEALYNLSFESNLYDSPRGEGESNRQERDRSAFLPLLNVYSQAWAYDLRRDPGVHETPPQPDNTAGLSWSEDGRVLFVGAENGIYQFHVNIQSRKFVPSISMR